MITLGYCLHDFFCSECISNGTLTEEDREYIQKEIAQLKEEIDGLSDRATFNEIFVLKGKDAPVQSAPGGASIISGLPDWVDMGSVGVMSETYETQETYQYEDGTGATQTGTENITHEAATVDFSKFDGTDDMKAELIGQGFL